MITINGKELGEGNHKKHHSEGILKKNRGVEALVNICQKSTIEWRIRIEKTS